MSDDKDKRPWWLDLVTTLTPGRAVLYVGLGFFGFVLWAARERPQDVLAYLAESPILAVLAGIGLALFVGGLVVAALISRSDERSDQLMASLRLQIQQHETEIARLRLRDIEREAELRELQRLERRCQRRLAAMERGFRSSGMGGYLADDDDHV